ncbi:MAG: hypothetical protein Q9227_001599 [Pyrenula ochraceoflavens]
MSSSTFQGVSPQQGGRPIRHRRQRPSEYDVSNVNRERVPLQQQQLYEEPKRSRRGLLRIFGRKKAPWRANRQHVLVYPDPVMDARQTSISTPAPASKALMKLNSSSLRQRSFSRRWNPDGSSIAQLTGRSSTRWDPPPLFQAYPQAVKHGKLKTPDLSADRILLLNERWAASEKAKSSPELRLFSTSIEQRGGPFLRADCTEKIYVLVTSGYLLQYSIEGHHDRLPEKMLQLTKESVAFASDAIPGQPRVIQVSETASEDGAFKIKSSQSLRSRFRLHDEEAKRVCKNFLLILGAAEDYSWLTAIRNEIASLGSLKYDEENIDEQASNRNCEHRVSRSIRTRESVSRLSSRLSSPAPSRKNSTAKSSISETYRASSDLHMPTYYTKSPIETSSWHYSAVETATLSRRSTLSLTSAISPPSLYGSELSSSPAPNDFAAATDSAATHALDWKGTHSIKEARCQSLSGSPRRNSLAALPLAHYRGQASTKPYCSSGTPSSAIEVTALVTDGKFYRPARGIIPRSHSVPPQPLPSSGWPRFSPRTSISVISEGPFEALIEQQRINGIPEAMPLQTAFKNVRESQPQARPLSKRTMSSTENARIGLHAPSPPPTTALPALPARALDRPRNVHRGQVPPYIPATRSPAEGSRQKVNVENVLPHEPNSHSTASGQIHQIQSGQVIVDLCSVVKELLENSLDASASFIEIRFKNSGLESIEVQDNGSGIAPSNYGNIALKHHTSKLSNYDDLSTLQTFGFRGEALSSLCALSNFRIVTAQAEEAPKGTKLTFETSGELKSTQMIASQKGTTAVVEGLFDRLPVRRRELEKNIKREYGKVIGLLHSYACISTGVKMTVKNSSPKARNTTVFATNGNASTRENIANVYGSKGLAALVELQLELPLSSDPAVRQDDGIDSNANRANKIRVHGYVSRPVYGEGRLAPDRQMFFVNSRPCGLPQIAKAFNEVYRSFNSSQSPFVFADFTMDTNSYDVNVSPDKRTILIHDSAALIDNLKVSLIEMFERQEQTMPQSQLLQPKLPAFKRLSLPRQGSTDSEPQSPVSKSPELSRESSKTIAYQETLVEEDVEGGNAPNLFNQFFRNHASTREDPQSPRRDTHSSKVQTSGLKASDHGNEGVDSGPQSSEPSLPQQDSSPQLSYQNINENANKRDNRFSDSKSPASKIDQPEDPVPRMSQESTAETPNIVQNAFDRMRRKRVQPEVATITIGDNTVTTVLGSQMPKRQRPLHHKVGKKAGCRPASASQAFGRGLRNFAAPGSRLPTNDTAESDKAESQEKDEDELYSTNYSSGNEENEQAEPVDFSPASNQSLGVTENENEHESSQDDSHFEENEAATSVSVQDSADEDYVDENEKKAREASRVQELIELAEGNARRPTEDGLKRATKAFKSGDRKESTACLLATLDGMVENIEAQAVLLNKRVEEYMDHASNGHGHDFMEATDPEERLLLTVSKSDFSKMRIVGQFNLGFMLTRRQQDRSQGPRPLRASDDLFIIDQHASDEKYNFERLQRETTVGNQRLVQAKTLDLTAVEEEIIAENIPALAKNGFVVDIDNSGKSATGHRCKLSSLPLSKEVVFSLQDLEELIHLLSENPVISADSFVPRPSKVRKMFAMRACRSSIMIGKTLTEKQMSTIVKHMGEIDKPWNCPHGRPTMRHLLSLHSMETWKEGDGLADFEGLIGKTADIWQAYSTG